MYTLHITKSRHDVKLPNGNMKIVQLINPLKIIHRLVLFIYWEILYSVLRAQIKSKFVLFYIAHSAKKSKWVTYYFDYFGSLRSPPKHGGNTISEQ